MLRRLAITAVMFVSPISALAQTPAPAAKPPKVLQLLVPADVDPARLLPPPAADGSAAAKADLADVHRAMAEASAERRAQAKWDDDHEDPSMFEPTLGARFDLAKLPATREVLAIVQNDASVAASGAKKLFQRKRPWVVDSTIKTCDPDDKPLSSYPSGHATLGYSLAMTLAALIPEKAQVLMTRGQDYAYSRVVCGSHYATDTRASQALAASFVSTLLKDPTFQVKLAAAHAELKGAGLAQ
ncbi:phosphatase PAP2 family protein [uncultured Caulobacter sp.]|uniref:phosphatase PAP2 family protein n=1 Tax=uncultured Caulobacter sp. TaxID=158749 RepID=UPI00262B18F0|nr:phosphatase PAP2 family protein [uncultured Caulobacter sp.]